MIELPTCRWRGPENESRFPCLSEKITATRGVTATSCRDCALADHEPAPPGTLKKVANLARTIAQHDQANLPAPAWTRCALRGDVLHTDHG